MDAADEVCKSCGSPVQKMNRNWSKFAKISAITLIIVAFGTYILLYNLDIIGPNFFGDIFGSAAAEESPVPDVGYAGQEPDEAVDIDIEATPERRSEEEQQVVLGSILSAVDTYVQEFSQFNPIISRMGYLHNVSTEEYVTIELLGRLGLLSEEYLDEDAFILYLRPRDLMLFDEITFESVPSAGQMVSLTVFVAHETPTGIGLYSRFGAQEIFRENLNLLLTDVYNPNNGEIYRPTVQDAVYQAVVEMISSSNPDSAAFIRYLAVDNLHGFVAFTVAGDDNIIINHVLSLQYDGEELIGVRLLAEGFENTTHPKTDINQAAPSFNFELMPDYDITGINLSQSGVQAFVESFAMRELLGLEEYDILIFASATDSFAYAVREQGNAFFGQYNNGWQVVPVEGWQVAETLMKENVNNPPLYIIWQK